MHVLVARAEQLGDDGSEDVLVAAGEMAGDDAVDDAIGPRVVAFGQQLHDLFGAQSEDEDVLRADFVANLDVRAVERADGQRTVERHLHVAGA